MPNQTETAAQPRLSGRKAQAARNNGLILDAARAVFLDDPTAPIAAVADRAGVGISALYRRYPSKEVLLRTLCHEGLRRFNAEADAALADPDGWRGFVGFLERVVEADVHSLTVKLAGTFTPDDSMLPDVIHAGEAGVELVRRAHASGRLRADFDPQDVGLLLEACAAVTMPDPVRTAELRQRVLALLLDGMTAEGDLPGPPPAEGEYAWRWERRL
ncbi:TetR/AcrR family transcriptional regulator [Nocardia sp. NPDC050718]|uniref:TetR/AcrR family transcriptional regulator n=1 Tax=Nocardia sp. NPDC050718 TaxID=3155788 RepID=UPI0033E8A4A1